MSSSTDRHLVRSLLLILAAIATALAVRAAIADKGGSYDPSDPTR